MVKAMQAMKAVPKAKAKVKKDKNEKGKGKRGQADSLTGSAWSAWMTHLSRVGPSWLFVLFALCHLLCCRVTEILKLQLQDIDFEKKNVKIKPLKKRGEIMKPISATLQKFLDKWRQDGGQSFTYTRKWGKQGLRTYRDTWSFPTEMEQYFFPPKRSDNKMGRMSKDPLLESSRGHYTWQYSIINGDIVPERMVSSNLFKLYCLSSAPTVDKTTNWTFEFSN